MSLKSVAEKRANFEDEHGTGIKVTISDIKSHIKGDQKEFKQLKTKAEDIEDKVEDMQEEDAQTLKDLNKESALIQKIAALVRVKIAKYFKG